jgi:hypothetical protein
MYETKSEKELRKELERFKRNPSQSCFNHLKYIIQNSNEKELLKFLAVEIAKDKSLSSLEPFIGDNANTPPYILEELALSENPLTRACIAFNPGTPFKSIRLLGQDQNEFVKLIANKKPFKKGFISTLLEKLEHIINYIKCLLGF